MYDVTLNLGISNIDLESAIRMILFANSKNHQYKDGRSEERRVVLVSFIMIYLKKKELNFKF